MHRNKYLQTLFLFLAPIWSFPTIAQNVYPFSFHTSDSLPLPALKELLFEKLPHATKHSSEEVLELLIAGDIMTHGPQIKAALREDSTYSFDECFSLVSPIINKADIAIGNLETTLGGKPYKGYPQFSSPDELVDALVKAGFDVLTTANNHAADTYRKGIRRTIEELKKQKVFTTGTFLDKTDRENRAPLILPGNGIKIAILAYTYGTNGIAVPPPAEVALIDTAVIRKEVKKAQNMGADYILTMIHWGIEYATEPGRAQIETAQFLHDIGVDAVIGSHPHVVQRSEIIPANVHNRKQTFVLYSLGNFISNQKDTPSRGGLMLKLRLVRPYKKAPIRTEPSYQYVWVNKEDNTGKAHYKLFPIKLNDNPPKDLPLHDYTAFSNFQRRYQNIHLTEKATNTFVVIPPLHPVDLQEVIKN